ncbi:MAG: hypothetical protein RL172_3001 [Bacteroidota bacterium]|jgi:5'-nucleotidase
MQQQKRLIVDMDGVLADVYSQFLYFKEKDTGIRLSTQELMGKSEADIFGDQWKYLYSKAFFRDAPVIEGSQKVLEQLNKCYELFIVSSATEFPQSLTEKQEWLNEHFPFITWKQMVFCGIKTVIKGDIMIDDHYKNLDYFSGQTILFTQPHNYGSPEKQHTRVNNWSDIAALLL